MEVVEVFAGGPNIAIKVPEHVWSETIAFYRDVLGLKQEGEDAIFSFGEGRRLHLDRRPQFPRGDVWLQIHTQDADAALAHLAGHGVPVRDELEGLPPRLRGHWISDPAGTVLLLNEPS